MKVLSVRSVNSLQSCHSLGSVQTMYGKDAQRNWLLMLLHDVLFVDNVIVLKISFREER